MKFSRITAIFMFAATLMGAMPAQAGVFDWLADLFGEETKNVPAQQTVPAQAPVAPARQRQADAPRGKHGKRGHRNHRNPVREVPARQVPAGQPARTVNPRAKTVTKAEKIKQALVRNAGIIAVGLVVSAAAGLLLNPDSRAKITEILDFAKAGLDNVNIFKDIFGTSRELKTGFKDLVDEIIDESEPAPAARR